MVSCEGLADRHEGFPLVAHQMCPRVHGLAQHPVCLTFGEIRCDMGSGLASAAPLFRRCWPLHDGERGGLRRPRLAFPSPAETRTTGVLAGAAADREFVHLDSARERLLAGQHQSQGVAHPPSRRLADPNRRSQAHRGDALTGRQNEPKPRQSDPQRQLGRMPRRPRGDGERQAAFPVRALIQAGTGRPPNVSSGQRRRSPAATPRTQTTARPRALLPAADDSGLHPQKPSPFHSPS